MPIFIRRIRRITLKKDGTDLDAVVFGTGKKSLILIPGLSFQQVKTAAIPLAYLYRIFAKEYTVYILDKKAVVPEGYTIREMANDVAFVIKQLQLDSVDVFGVSQGGMIAQYLAIDHPQLVHKLVLGVTASKQNEIMRTVIHHWIKLAEHHEYQTLVLDMLEKMYSEAYRKKYRCLFLILSKIAKIKKPKDFNRFIALAKSCLTCDAYPELHKITCPVLIIGGKQDQVVTGRASEEIAEALKCKVELYLYDKFGHAAYEEAPDYNQRIAQFLKS